MSLFQDTATKMDEFSGKLDEINQRQAEVMQRQDKIETELAHRNALKQQRSELIKTFTDPG